MILESDILLDEIRHELEPIKNFLRYNYINNELVCVSLDIPFKLFNNFFPEITRKNLIKTLDWLNDHKTVVKHVLKE